MKRNTWRLVLLAAAGMGIVVGLWAERGRSGDADAERRIAALQKAIAAEGLCWQAGETSMSRLSEEERQRRLGALPEPMEEPTVEAESTMAVGALPAILDWRDRNGNWVTAIRDQGDCGSCWAFSTAGVLESLVKIAKNIKTDIDLSEETLVHCSDAGGCGGGYQSKAADFVRRTGIPREDCYPYSATDGSCHPCAGWMSKTVKITSWKGYANASKTILQNALLSAPITASMAVYSDFYNYRSGIYERTSGATYKGGHAIVIVGYNNTEGYWICKNSWGTNWGENGFFRIRMGNSEIAEYCTSLSGPRLDNQPPVLQAIPAQTGEEGKTLAFSLSASDSDYDTLTFSAKNLPEGAALDAATGDFAWTPGFTQSGVYSVQFGVSDGINTVVKTASITVTNVKYKTW
jgi:C1A family cysteine protease